MTSIETIEARTESSPLRTIEFDKVSDFKLRPGTFIYHIKGEGLPIYLFGKFTQVGSPLMVFGQGMVARDQVQLPRFQRMNWAPAFPENMLIINDPTLFLADDVTLGWLLGTHENYIMPKIAEVVRRARDQLDIADSNILFYGTSAGGFGSLMLSTQFENSAVFVNNPQTNVLKFRRGGVARLLQVAFHGLNREEAAKRYGARLSYVEALRQGAKLPRLYYLQNFLDEDHYEDQLLPLMAEAKFSAKGKSGTHLERQFIVDLYIDEKTLHNPLGLTRMQACMDIVREWIRIERD
ncbi:hypothetical protein [Roseomonas sp. KE0001]|uniref:hypothetical protein n=1 Tax=Roseomonas sp. KE0001 TaxID=2479201 RepID=UPI0018DFB3DA|nr:hypothetical protein [Roseomonas sp. KE0001]MBI0434290.1 hypothetical protein [Roseomonas sp. KE0001]